MKTRASWPLVALAAACTLALGACSKVIDRADDSGKAAEAVPGVTGQGTADAGSQATPPGVGLNGGLGTATSTMGAASAPAAAVGNGSTNTTPGSAVGTRP